MAFPWKKIVDGWDYKFERHKERSRIKRHTENVINEEIYGETSDRRIGKKKKKNIEKPYKILVKYKENYNGFWKRSKNWRLENEFSNKNDRDHELAKMKRSWYNNIYDFTKADNDEECEKLLAS